MHCIVLSVIVLAVAILTVAASADLYSGKGSIKGTNKIFASIHDRPLARGHRAFVIFNALSKDIPCRICQYRHYRRVFNMICV